MVRISEIKKNKIKSNILALLYEKFPKSLFTAEISKIEARDEEFVKSLLFDLKEKGLVVSIRKNPKGVIFTRRIRWTLTKKVYDIYSEKSKQ